MTENEPLAAYDYDITARAIFIYDATYIDFFIGWQTKYEVVRTLESRAEWPSGSVNHVLTALVEAERLARSDLARLTDWEGDVRGGEPYFVPVPEKDENGTRWVVCIKQDNNGTTYVWSPVPLPWLARHENHPTVMTASGERR